MTRDQLEHVSRAAATIAAADDLVLVGGEAILAAHPDVPAERTASVEAEVYPRNHPERADLIDATIGEDSPCHETFGTSRPSAARRAELARVLEAAARAVGRAGT